MKCDEVANQLIAYLDQTADAAVAVEVRSHLAGCKSCALEARRLAETWDVLGILPEIQPSANFRPVFWEKVRREKSSWLSLPRLAPALAGFVAVWVTGVALGLYLYLQAPQSSATSAMGMGETVADAYLNRVERRNI